MTPTNHARQAEDLGLALLIAEFEGDAYEPIAVVATRAEADELARADLARRMRALEAGGEPACPAAYKLWSRRFDGVFQAAADIVI
jgi:hypothetical protein